MCKRSVKKLKRVGKGFTFQQRVLSGQFEAMKLRKEVISDALMAKMLASGAILFQPQGEVLPVTSEVTPEFLPETPLVESVTVEPVEATVTEQ